MKNDIEKLDQLEKSLLSKNAILIERTLESFGLRTRVAKLNIEKEYTEYCLEIVVGTNLEELEKHSRDLALALASPTGKVKMIIPIPGRALIGIQVPRSTESDLQKMEKLIKDKKKNNTWKNSFSNVFMFIGYLFFALGEKINKD